MNKLSAFSYQPSVRKPLRLRLFAPLRCILLLAILSACVPVQQPDVLLETAGPSFVVTDETYVNSAFSVRYPGGWRVVTGEASVPPSVIFVAPDEVSTLQIQVGHLESGDFSNPKLKTDVRGLTLSNGVDITVILSAPTESWDALLPTFEQIIASIQAT